MAFTRSRPTWIIIVTGGLILAAIGPAFAGTESGSGGNRTAAAAATPTGSLYVPVAPARLLDTRSGVGAPAHAVASHQAVTLHVVGGSVPASATAVAVNVTVTQPKAAGWVSVGPATVTTTSNLNFAAGQTIPNLVISKVSAAGTISLYNGSSNTIQLIADLQGYYTQSGDGSVYAALAPSRLLDTRSGVGAPAHAVASHQAVTLHVVGGSVPASATAVAVNVTVTQPKAAGWVSVGPATVTTTSNLNFAAGQTIPNLVISKVSAAGTISLYNGSSNTIQLIADLQGYYTQSGDGSVYAALAPSRLLDTRSGVGAPAHAVASHQAVTLHVVGGSVPASATAVAVNVTVTQPKAAGWVSVGPATVTTTSNLNFAAGQTIPNLVISKVSAAGTISLYNGSSNTIQLIADLQGYDMPAPLAVTTSGLADGEAGVTYIQQLVAVGGTEPYSWSGTGLPAGVSVSSDGFVFGTPTATGTAHVTLTVTDSAAQTASTTLDLAVPTSLPAGCIGQSCAQLSPDGQTVQIPATRVGAVVRDNSGNVTQLVLAGAAPDVGQVLVVAATADAPSGLIVVVDSVSDNGDGTSTVDVSAAGPADAYAQGTVNTIGTATTQSEPNGLTAATVGPTTAAGQAKLNRSARARSFATQPGDRSTTAPTKLTCDNAVTTSLFGIGLTPSLTPTLVALWQHPYFGGGGIYIGTGGLSLYQFDLDGSITANLGISISGSATCTLTFPSFRATAPAGTLGAVLLDITPTLTFSVTGKVDIRTSVTFECSAEYRWDQGVESKLGFCTHHAQPLQLSADSGIDATAKMALDASLTLDDLVGIQGSISGTVHAGYHPTQHPVAEVDAHVDYDLTGCLACFWKGTPAKITIGSGTLFSSKTLLNYDTAPPPPGSTGPVITTSQLPGGVVGQPYQAKLTTADGRSGTWSIASGSLPDGLDLVDDQITGKPLTQQAASFHVSFTDDFGRVATAALSITVVRGGGGMGAIENLDYCRQNVFAANDDNSTDPVDLPFPVNFFGTTYSSTYISNNGYVVFDGPQGTYTPYPLVDEVPSPIIAPFFADVDTRNPDSALVTYGASPDGRTFCVNWVGVGYFDQHVDKLDNFQLLLVDRSDVAPGDFDIVFNYGDMSWETGDASNGVGGIGGTSARSGYSAGTGDPGTSSELPGSGVPGMLLDGEPDQLSASSTPAGQPAGRYMFPIRN